MKSREILIYFFIKKVCKKGFVRYIILSSWKNETSEYNSSLYSILIY